MTVEAPREVHLLTVQTKLRVFDKVLLNAAVHWESDILVLEGIQESADLELEKSPGLDLAAP